MPRRKKRKRKRQKQAGRGRLSGIYIVDFRPDRVARWTAAGSPKRCIEHLNAYVRMGINTIGLRCTGWDQMRQLRRVIEEILPYVETGR